MSSQNDVSPSSPRDAVYIQDGLRVEHADGSYTVTHAGGISVRHRADGNIEGKLLSSNMPT